MYLKKYIFKILKSLSEIIIPEIYMENDLDFIKVSSSQKNKNKLSDIKDQVF